NGTRHVVEFVRRNEFPDPEDDLIVEESLAVPKLVNLGAIQRLGAWQAVIVLHTACLTVGVLPVELKKLNAEGCALPVQELFGVEIRTNDNRTIPAPFTGLGATRDESVRIHQPETAEPQPGVRRQLKQSPGETGAGKFIFCGRVTGDRIGSFGGQLVGNPRFRRRLSAASTWQDGGHT